MLRVRMLLLVTLPVPMQVGGLVGGVSLSVPPLLVGVRLVGHIRRNILPGSLSKLGRIAKSSGCFVFGPFNSETMKTASAIPAYFTSFSLLRRFGTAFVATTLCQERSSDCRQHTVRYQQLS